MNKKAANENNTKPKLETYWIPQDVYEKVMADLATPETPMSKNMDLRAKAMCLERMPINKYLRTPFTRPTLIEIAKLALEKRDWRKLYVILLQCMKTNDKLMIHEVLEYMFVALSADPVATELDSLKKFLLGCKLCKNDEEIETYIRNAYTLYPKDDLESEEINKEQDKKPEEVDPENLQSTNDELSDIDGNLELLKVEKVEK